MRIKIILALVLIAMFAQSSSQFRFKFLFSKSKNNELLDNFKDDIEVKIKKGIEEHIEREKEKDPDFKIITLENIIQRIDSTFKKWEKESKKINQNIQKEIKSLKNSSKNERYINKAFEFLVKEINKNKSTKSIFDSKDASKESLERCQSKLNSFVMTPPEFIGHFMRQGISEVQVGYNNDLELTSGESSYLVEPFKGIFDRKNADIFKMKLIDLKNKWYKVVVKVVLNEQYHDGNNVQMRSVVGINTCTFKVDLKKKQEEKTVIIKPNTDLVERNEQSIKDIEIPKLKFNFGRFLTQESEIKLSLIDQMEEKMPFDFDETTNNQEYIVESQFGSCLDLQFMNPIKIMSGEF